MKKITGFITLLVFLSNMSLSAQTNFYINAGVAIPLNPYTSGTNEKNCVLLSENGRYGGAGVGANLDLKVKFNIGVKGLGLFLSIDGIYNGLYDGMKDYFDDLKYQLLQEFDDGYVDMSIPQYIHASAMTGLNYVYEINPKFGVYVEAGIGANFRYITDFYVGATEYYNNHSSYFWISETASYDPKFSLAFQVGTGIEINKRFVLGVNFYHLGSTRVQGRDYTIVSDNGDWDTKTQYFRFHDVAPMLIMARLGVKLGK